jgi:hypothetical protein
LLEDRNEIYYASIGAYREECSGYGGSYYY